MIDLTHPIEPGMPVYPGTEGPRLETANTCEKDGFRETLLTLYSHTGTHMDAPAHLYADGTTLDRFPAAQFVGSAVVVDCSELRAGQPMTMAHVERQREAADGAEFLLFRTGWDRYWGQDAYFGDYPCIDLEVVDYVLRTGKKGIGLDTIGLDPIADANLTRHKRLLAGGAVVVIENLKGLGRIGRGPFTLCALPLQFRDADGAPVRAVAMLEGNG
ncbi:cyclase family protein [Fretibacterium sp. OH1220_COT-178]|uniref:cyclase family protein n=1 Tax=Fretibacterium sp. OH1220_COT-178 TaxID=2491047 RepID=UPI001F4632C0|nr:cyclase family protein [Fretibacterium sp. OH1220_COT-178]